jgi:hypothetical protein
MPSIAAAIVVANLVAGTACAIPLVKVVRDTGSARIVRRSVAYRAAPRRMRRRRWGHGCSAWRWREWWDMLFGAHRFLKAPRDAALESL